MKEYDLRIGKYFLYKIQKASIIKHYTTLVSLIHEKKKKNPALDKVKRQATHWKNVFVTYISAKGLV